MKNSARLLSLGILALVFSCKKPTEPAQPITNHTSSVTVDDITGSYIGLQTHHKIDYAYGMGQTYLRDTTFTTNDTLLIEKISADSFKLSNGDKWAVYGKPLRFAFDTSNVYKMGNPSYSGSKDSLIIRFEVTGDSMVIEKHELSPGTSAYHIYDYTFRGKK